MALSAAWAGGQEQPDRHEFLSSPLKSSNCYRERIFRCSPNSLTCSPMACRRVRLMRYCGRRGGSSAGALSSGRPTGTLRSRVMAASELLNEQLGAVTHVEQNGGYVIRGEGCPLSGLDREARRRVSRDGESRQRIHRRVSSRVLRARTASSLLF
jgi:hypothetical protein